MTSPERILTGLLVAVAPPLLLLVGVTLLARWLLPGADAVVIAAAVIGLSAAWVALLTVVYGRVLRGELASLTRLAAPSSPAENDPLDATARLSATLAERDRQLVELAARVGRAPIDERPGAVAAHMVEAARRVTGDPTWNLALLACESPHLLAPGLYRTEVEGEPEPLAELHSWASVTLAERHRGEAAVIDGPWGAFLAVGMTAGDRLHGVLLAPWEGRPSPTVAELALVRLVGQHAAIALDHGLLFARVREQSASIERMAATQRDFLRGVTHDLGTPLTSIRAAASELRGSGAVGAEGTADLELIEHQADRLRRMVAQLLAMSRLEAGAIEARSEIVNPRNLVERTWAALRSADRALELEADGERLVLIADPDRLEQVLWAVLDNAVKYSPAGSAVRVRIGPVDGRSDVGRISVSDAGDGMDPETVERAFEQFFRAPDARRRIPDGSGIGLYTARGLVEAMGGAIHLESRPGAGTTVSIDLPAESVVPETTEPAVEAGIGARRPA